MDAVMADDGRVKRRHSGTSYKFQRLREKIRRAVEHGELSGKLPGERLLARRFHVNAKTLGKALTDLAAEGVLDRSIGRGTFVKGSAPAAPSATGRWLVLCEPGDENACAVRMLREMNPELQTVTSLNHMRPSFINQFTAVINLTAAAPEPILRDLLVRNMQIVAVNHEPRAFSTHAVLADVTLGVMRMGRDALLAGHRRLGAIEPRGHTAVAHALQQAARRYSPDAVVDAAIPADAPGLVQSGATALVCGSIRDARATRDALEAQNIAIPGRVSLTAIGCKCPEAACSGYFVDCRQIAESVVNMLKECQTRPITLWLPGTWVDLGTFAPIGTGHSIDHNMPLKLSGVVA